MLEFDKVSFNLGEEKIKNIKSPVLLISGDNDGVDKGVLIQTYKLPGGTLLADMAGVPKSRLAKVPGQGHVSLMMHSETVLRFINEFL